jgi:hypothetical protein
LEREMAYKTFEYSLDEFSDEELIEELNSRSISTYHHSSKDIKNAIDCYRRGDIKETLIYLERAFPEFYDISKKVNL